MEYRPLKDFLYISISDIEGNGLFTRTPLEPKTVLGISHVKYDSGDFHNNLIRTGLGAFINHSEKANAVLVEEEEYYYLIVDEYIPANSEITTNYSKSECGCNYVEELRNKK